VTLQAGLHVGVLAGDYHQDPCQQPSLSASIANILVSQTPLHAWTAHPKLNPAFRRKTDEKFDLGTAAHAMLLEGDGEKIAVVAADDWRTKAAKEQRDEARADGKVPLLAVQAGELFEMVAAAQTQLAAFNLDPPCFTEGHPEHTLIWDEDGVTCRARLDWLRDDYAAIDDYKTTSASADPSRWVRTMYGLGGDVQAAFYLRGCERVLNVRPEWRYVVQETYPPYALSVVTLAASVLEVGGDKVEKAIRIWRDCLERDEWPAYPAVAERVEIPAYEETRWLERDAA
jgi:hypothetical protein